MPALTSTDPSTDTIPGITAPMRSLVAELEQISISAPEGRRAAEIATALQPYLGHRHLLGPAHLQWSDDHYRTNVVHVGAGGAYSIVALVWRPGQRTPIHSHRSWCVVGVHQGRELERTFRRRAGRLVEQGRQRLDAGAVTWLAAGDDDIHDVTNVARGTTVSIHVYGLDYRATGSSILDLYPDPTAAAA